MKNVNMSKRFSIMLVVLTILSGCGSDELTDTKNRNSDDIPISIINPNSIAGMWLFDEGVGNLTKDSSGNGFLGLLNGNVKWVDGKFGKGLEFHGDDYVQIKDSEKWLAFGGKSPFSITAWVLYYDTIQTGDGTIISKYNAGVIGSYVLTYGEYGINKVGFSREVAPWRLVGNASLPIGKFGHIAATYDGKEMKIYVDGKLDAKQDSGEQTTDIVTPVLIGSRLTSGKPSVFFKGILDEVILFNIALDNNQILEVMKGM